MIEHQSRGRDIPQHGNRSPPEPPHTIFVPEEKQRQKCDQVRAGTPKKHIRRAVDRSICRGIVRFRGHSGFYIRTVVLPVQTARIQRERVFGKWGNKAEGSCVEAVGRLNDVPKNVRAVQTVLDDYVRVLPQCLQIDRKGVAGGDIRDLIRRGACRTAPVIGIMSHKARVIFAPVLQRQRLFHDLLALLRERELLVDAGACGAHHGRIWGHAVRHNVKRHEYRPLIHREKHHGGQRRDGGFPF